MDLEKLKRYSIALDNISSRRRLLRNAQFISNQEKLAGIFVDIAFENNSSEQLYKILGIDLFEKLALAWTLEDLSDLIFTIPFFDIEIPESSHLLFVLFNAWKNNFINNELMLEDFLKECIIGITQREDLLSSTPSVKIDEEARSKLFERFKLES